MRLFTDFYTGFQKGIAQKTCHAELFSTSAQPGITSRF